MQRYNFFSTFASIRAIKFGLCPKGAFCVAFCFVKCGFRPVAGGVCPLSSRSRRFRASERWTARFRRLEASAPIRCCSIFRRSEASAPIGRYCCPGKKHWRCERTQTGCNPPVQEHQRNKSPEGATEYLTCLISTCIYFCRPLGAFSVVASLPGACAPLCGLSSLWDFRVSPLGCFSSGKPNNRRISRGALNYPRTTIIRKLPYNGRIPCEFLGLRIRYLPMEWAFFAVLPYS